MCHQYEFRFVQFRVNDGGFADTVSDTTVVSWTLPAMSPGDRLARSYVVQVDADLVSGTQIINDDYSTMWWKERTKEFLYNSGSPVTTTVNPVFPPSFIPDADSI